MKNMTKITAAALALLAGQAAAQVEHGTVNVVEVSPCGRNCLRSTVEAQGQFNNDSQCSLGPYK